MEILKKLKKQGMRITKSRTAILNVLNEHPLTVQEILSLLKKKQIKIDIVSIYRNLELFLKLGIIIEVNLGDKKKRYELKDEKKHHHHLTCIRCGNIENIQIKESLLLNQMRIKSRFKILNHSLEFFGLCTKCQ